MTNDRIVKSIATLGPLGYSPKAPGTVGTALSCLLYIIIRPDTLFLLIIVTVLFFAGTIASARAEKILNEKDSPHIVIDEFVGYLVSVLWIPFGIKEVLLSFVIFRGFDIVKPPPIRYIEGHMNCGLGVMFDDILAGIYTNLVLRLILML